MIDSGGDDPLSALTSGAVGSCLVNSIPMLELGARSVRPSIMSICFNAVRGTRGLGSRCMPRSMVVSWSLGSTSE